MKKIVFVNKPINNKKEDLIGIESSVKMIEEAVDNEANIIGVIGDFGTGKTSLTDLLKINWRKPILINLWDSIDEKDDQKNINRLTKNFLFQMALGKSQNFAKYINRKLSKNYGNLSLSTSSKRVWIFAIVSCIFFMIYKIGEKLPNSITDTNIINLLNLWELRSLEKYVYLYYELFKNLNMVFLIICFLFGIIAFLNTNIAFSLWNSQGRRNPENNDIYDTYIEIANNLRRKLVRFGKKSKRVIIIEDLDRISNKKEVINFVKELYRFNNLLPINLKKKFVFIISIKSEEALLIEESNEDNKFIYSKIFDYKINLNQIHNENCEDIILKLLKTKKELVEKTLNITLEDKLPKDFSWIMKGQNLTIRDIKDRLNRSFSLFDSLKNKANSNNTVIDFQKCTIISYLENEYSIDLRNLIRNEEEFSEIIQESYKVQQGNNSLDNKKNDILKIIKSKRSNYKEEFLKELSELIASNLIDDDFKMYFYNYPKGQFIKNTNEKYVEEILLYPNREKEFINNEKIDYVYINNPKFIEECYKKRIDQSFPLVKEVLENEKLFSIALEKFYKELLELMIKEIKWEQKDIKKSERILIEILGFKNVKTEKIVKDYAIHITDEINVMSEKEITKVRKIIIDLSKNKVIYFKSLFISHDMPLITKEELDLIKDKKIKLQLVNEKIIDSNGMKYISNMLNEEKLYDDDYAKALGIYLGTKENIELTEIADKLLEFLMINKSIHNEIFKVITTSYLEGNITKITKEQICNYINELESDNITNEYLDFIEELKLPKIKDDILLKLKQIEKYNTYTINLIKQNRFTELKLGNNADNIKEVITNIYNEITDDFCKLREEIVKWVLVKEYRELFFGKYPIITEKELEHINSISELKYCIDFKKLTENNYLYIINKMSKLYRKKEELLEIIKCFNFNETSNSIDINLSQKCFEAFEWKKNITRNLSDTDKTFIYKNFYEILKLQNPENAYMFCKRTNMLIGELENIIYSAITTGRFIKIKYYELINEINKPTNITTQILIQIYEYDYPLNTNITQIMYKNQQYKTYIVGKTLFNNEFEFEENIDFKIYMDIFNNIENVYNLMIKNYSFLQAIMNKKEYENINSNDKIEKLYILRQPIEFVKFLFNKLSEEEIYKYIKYEWRDNDNQIQRWHLDTPNDSKQFKIFVCQDENTKYLMNEELYNMFKEKLWTPSERTAVTKARNSKLKELGK